MSTRDQAAAALLSRLAMAFDGAVLGVTVAFFAAQTWSTYLFSSRALLKIRSAPSPPISDLRSLLSSQDSSSEGMLVVIRGAVHEDQKPLVSHGTGEKAVVVQRVQTCLYNEWKGIFGWNFDLHTLFVRTRKEQQSYSLRSVPFILTEGTSWPYQGFVHVKLIGSSQPMPLSTAYHQLLPVPSLPSSFFQAIFGSGFPVAILDEEKILPVGKVITAVGICAMHDGSLEIKSSDDLPCFLTDRTKNEVEADLALSCGVLFWGGVILGTLSIGILSYSMIRNWWRWREWRNRRRHDRETHETNVEVHIDDSDDEELGDVPDGQLCVICLARRRRSAFTPCGHLVCCPRCAMVVEQDLSPKCPLCRQSIRSSIRIYAS